MTVASPTVLILGARSEIAKALARVYASHGYDVVLAARQSENLAPDAADLTLRFGRTVKTREFDVLKTADHNAFVEGLTPLPDTVIAVVGLMTPQAEAEADFLAADLMIRSNYVGLVSILGLFANKMQERGSGSIVALSSVAGERGRATNYIYGSAKAGLTAYLSGLRARLFKSGVTVITVKPGFVRTRMTEGMALPAPLTAEPSELAEAIWHAHLRKRSEIYHRKIWRLIMFVIRCLPENIFKRLKF